MKVSKELIKGTTPMLIMGVLKQKDMYGYKIIKEIENYLESYWEQCDGRKRKYYHLTQKGKAQLQEKQEEWKAFSTSVNKVLQIST